MIVGESRLVRTIDELNSDDVDIVGGKSANLGELTSLDVPVLPGFTTTATAYDQYLTKTDLDEWIADQLEGLDPDDVGDLQERGARIRQRIESTEMLNDLERAIRDAYQQLGEQVDTANPMVAVRSSATAEDLPTASFAGQQETFLNISAEQKFIESVKRCYASLFTDRAIAYRADKEFDHLVVKLACIVQVMGRADLGCSGVVFTLDPDTGFENAIVIEATYGLGGTPRPR